MSPTARQRMQVRVPMLLVSGAAWIWLVATAMPHCTDMAGWLAMLVAMMGPLLIAPVRHVYESSLARRRTRSITLFLAGYLAVWMAAGAVMTSLTVPVALAAVLALVWQCSPLKQLCLNRGHAHTELSAFGWAADRDALNFGLRHGVWCVGSCWALMLLPMVGSRGHLAAMAAVTLWLIAERLETPKTPSWRLRVPGIAWRIAVAQTRFVLSRG